MLHSQKGTVVILNKYIQVRTCNLRIVVLSVYIFITATSIKYTDGYIA